VATQVLVHLEASEALASRAHSLAVRVIDGEGEVVFAQVSSVGSEVRLPATVPVVPRDGDASRRFVLEARLLDEDETSISRTSTEEGFVEGELREVTLTFPDAFPYDTEPAMVFDVPTFETTALGFVDVPGSEFVITPATPEETWVVIVVGYLTANGSTGMFEGPGGVRVMVNSVERAIGEAIGWRGTSFQAVEIIRGSEARIHLQIKANTSRDARIRDARIFAFRLPPFADLQVAERDGDVVVPSEPTRALELTFTPAAPGRYLFLVNAAAGGRPGDRGVRARVVTPSMESWPTATDFSFSRTALLPNFLARVETLEAVEQTFALEAMSGSVDGDATVRYPRIVAFRVDELPALASLLTTTAIVAEGTTLTDVHELTVPPAPSGSQWLTIQSVVWTVIAEEEVPTTPPPELPGTEARVVFERDARVYDRGFHSITNETRTTSSLVDVVDTDEGVVLRSAIGSGFLVTSDPTGFRSEGRALEAVSIALRL
jgi:hypothetical protein